MKKFFYSLLLLLGISIVLSSCEKIGIGGNDSGDFDGAWDTQFERNDGYEGGRTILDYTFDEHGDKLYGYDYEWYRTAYYEIDGSTITVYEYVNCVCTEGGVFDRDENYRIKGNITKSYGYYEVKGKYKFEYIKPHIYIDGKNIYDLVSKSKDKMTWLYVFDGEDWIDEEDDFYNMFLTRRKKK